MCNVKGTHYTMQEIFVPVLSAVLMLFGISISSVFLHRKNIKELNIKITIKNGIEITSRFYNK